MKNNNTQRRNCAYGTFLFRDGGYLPGLLMVAYQLKRLGLNGARLVCCYTPDIDQGVVDLLRLMYDDVWPVEYLAFGRKRKGRQAPLTSMFTRFRLLQGLPEKDEKTFEKMLIFDADMLPIKSYDSLFDLQCPAGVINESKDHMKADYRYSQTAKEWEWHEKYNDICPHGSKIPKSITDRPMQAPEENMGINGGLMMLRPSQENFKAFESWCLDKDNRRAIDAMDWPDMQSITAFYSGQWTSIDAKYLGLYGYPNIQSLSGVHFIGPKPWQRNLKGFEYRINKYPDYRLWAEEYIKMCEDMPEILGYKPLENLKQSIQAIL
ncbi:hypothetical protein KA021_01875 [Candidatus Saccharibacteria bacterium]|jgi:alpha-N-acetylglucosamine transferase|nr:hypothetical protein [Candidatus Saccharibacteria bacterium]